MRLIFTSDLHGHINRYDELSQLAQRHQPDVLIIGGDLLPHQSPGQAGLYHQLDFVESAFRSFLESLSNSTLVGAILGNDDWAACIPKLKTLSQFYPFHMLSESPVEINGIQFYGYSFLPPTPFTAKDFDKCDTNEDAAPSTPVLSYISQDHDIKPIDTQLLFSQRNTIKEDLSKIKPENPHIMVAHAPPYGTHLDRLYHGQAVGSRSIYQWIKTHAPIISLHGHIHESPKVTGQYWDRIGETICLNPGQIENHLSAVIVELDESIHIRHTIYGVLTE